MPMFLDTRGQPKLAIAICGRCNGKFPYSELEQDPNIPGLWVCSEDRDLFDPYRLPARQTENITLEHPRPDVDISTQGPTLVYANQVYDIGSMVFPRPWRALQAYLVGETIWPEDINLDTTTLPQRWFLCIGAGVSGAVAPDWPLIQGVEFTEGSVEWRCLGLYP